jgi:hypothetical protein
MKLEIRYLEGLDETRKAAWTIDKLMGEGKVFEGLGSKYIGIADFNNGNTEHLEGYLTFEEPSILALRELETQGGQLVKRKYSLIGNKEDLDRFYEMIKE